MNLTLLQTQPYEGTHQLFNKQLGFPIKELTRQPISAQQFLRSHHDPETHAVIERIFLAGQISSDDIGTTTLQTPVSGRYPGMLVLCVEINITSPTRGMLAELTNALNRATPSRPVAVVFLYNNCSRMALTSCERSEYQQKWRQGERIGRTAVLFDINLSSPSNEHLSVLNSLRIDAFREDPANVETILEHWRERLRSSDRSLLEEIAHDWIVENETFPPLDDFGSIFGREAVGTIRNYTNWGRYYPFLLQSIGSEPTLVKTLKNAVAKLFHKQYERFHNLHRVAPSVEILESQNSYEDLSLCDKETISKFLSSSPTDNESVKTWMDRLNDSITRLRSDLDGTGEVEADEGSDEDQE